MRGRVLLSYVERHGSTNPLLPSICTLFAVAALLCRSMMSNPQAMQGMMEMLGGRGGAAVPPADDDAPEEFSDMPELLHD